MYKLAFDVVRTRTGDQLHLRYCDVIPSGPKKGLLSVERRTLCGCYVAWELTNRDVKARPGLLCVKCFPAGADAIGAYRNTEIVPWTAPLSSPCSI